MNHFRWARLYLLVISVVDILLGLQVFQLNYFAYQLTILTGSGANNGIGVAGFELNVCS
jgi:hypothetical protein